MKRMTKIMSLAALALIAAGCSKAIKVGAGFVSFQMGDFASVEDVTKSQVSEYTSVPSASDFVLTIKDASDAIAWTGKAGDWTAENTLGQGNYSVSATYGTPGEEGKNKPYFTGEQSFTVVGGETANVTIPVALGNTIIKLVCTENFKNYFSNCSFTISTGTGNNFTLEDGEAAFIEAFRFSISGTMSNPQGKVSTFSKAYESSIEAKTCYTLKIDASNIGGTTISISFNDSVETVDLGEIEMNE